MIILKVTKSQGFTLSLEDTFFEKPQGVKLTAPSPPAVLGLKAVFQFSEEFQCGSFAELYYEYS